MQCKDSLYSAPRAKIFERKVESILKIATYCTSRYIQLDCHRLRSSSISPINNFQLDLPILPGRLIESIRPACSLETYPHAFHTYRTPAPCYIFFICPAPCFLHKLFFEEFRVYPLHAIQSPLPNLVHAIRMTKLEERLIMLLSYPLLDIFIIQP